MEPVYLVLVYYTQSSAIIKWKCECRVYANEEIAYCFICTGITRDTEGFLNMGNNVNVVNETIHSFLLRQFQQQLPIVRILIDFCRPESSWTGNAESSYLCAKRGKKIQPRKANQLRAERRKMKSKLSNVGKSTPSKRKSRSHDGANNNTSRFQMRHNTIRK